jgi:CheY-like chemotaxis protein
MAHTKHLPLRLLVEKNVSVLIDSHYFSQVITNVIGNAIKFTDRGGITITLSAPEERNLALIKVRDTGIGISQEFLPHIFDEFKQESAGYQRSFEGSGLGLTISKRLLSLMGGTIEVESTKGEGTTFTVAVPLDTKRVHTSSTTLTKDTTSNFYSASDRLPSILLVEDTMETAEMVKYFLRSSADLTIANDAAQAERAISTNSFDLILMDINLGTGLTGLDLTQQLRSNNSLSRIPIIALTAYAMKGDRETAINAGCTDYLSKPFTKDQLVEIIQRYV